MAKDVVVHPARRKTARYYRGTVRRLPLARQRLWLEQPTTQEAMTPEWCDLQLRRLDQAELKLQAIVPSGAWLEAVWRGAAVFPPQDEFCPLATAAVLYGAAARGAMKVRHLQACLNLLTRGADPLQVIVRLSCRMRLSYCHTSYGTGTLAEPLPTRPTRRLLPRESLEIEDRVDRLSSKEAIFHDAPPSPSARAIIRLGFTRGRDASKAARERKKKELEEKRRAARMRAELGLEEEGDAEMLSEQDDDDIDDEDAGV